MLVFMIGIEILLSSNPNTEHLKCGYLNIIPKLPNETNRIQETFAFLRHVFLPISGVLIIDPTSKLWIFFVFKWNPSIIVFLFVRNYSR